MAEVQNRLMKRADVEIRTALSRSTIYGKLNPKERGFDSSFPSPIRTGSSFVRWIESQVNARLQSRVAASRA